MVSVDLESYLEDMECEECGCVGMEGTGGEYCMCPVCGKEYSIFDYEGSEEYYSSERREKEEYLEQKICYNCGSMGGTFVLDEENDDVYRCKVCGFEGSFQDDIDARDWFWDEGLHGYTEEEKGEVFDGYDV